MSLMWNFLNQRGDFMLTKDDFLKKVTKAREIEKKDWTASLKSSGENKLEDIKTKYEEVVKKYIFPYGPERDEFLACQDLTLPITVNRNGKQITEHSLTRKGIEFFNNKLKCGESGFAYIKPNEIDQNLVDEIITHLPSYLRYRESQNASSEVVMRTICGYYCNPDVQEMVKDGIMDSVEYNLSTLSEVLNNLNVFAMAALQEIGIDDEPEVCSIKDLPNEILRWILDNEQKNPCLEKYLENDIGELAKKCLSNQRKFKPFPNTELRLLVSKSLTRYDEIINLMSVIYEGRDLNTLEAKIWDEKLSPASDIPQDLADRLDKIGSVVKQRAVGEQLKILEQKMMTFVKETKLAEIHGKTSFSEIQGGHHRINEEAKVARIFLDAVPMNVVKDNPDYCLFTIDVSLTHNPGMTSGSVFSLAQCNQAQVNSWMLKQLSQQQNHNFAMDPTSIRFSTIPWSIYSEEAFYKSSLNNTDLVTETIFIQPDDLKSPHYLDTITMIPKNVSCLTIDQREMIQAGIEENVEMSKDGYGEDIFFDFGR